MGIDDPVKRAPENKCVIAEPAGFEYAKVIVDGDIRMSPHCVDDDGIIPLFVYVRNLEKFSTAVRKINKEWLS
jgi:hypothetical protein